MKSRVLSASGRMFTDMRTLITSLVLTALAFSSHAGAAPKVPRKAAEFVIQTPDGKRQLLSSYRGKTVVLALMFTTCPHCQKTAGLLAQVQKEYANKGVQVLGAAFDQGAAFNIQNFNKVFGVNFPCGYSSQKAVMDFLEITEPPFVPDLVFIDKTGTIRAQYVGDEKFLSNQEVNIRAELDKLIR